MTDACLSQQPDRRRHRRLRVLKAGLIRCDGVTIPCTVRNWSDAGAGIVLEHPSLLPETAELVLVQSEAARRCRKIWQNELRAGFCFLAAG
jgi:hypothetical protein